MTNKEISFNKRAPFERYRTFRIRPMKVSRERRPDIIEVLTKAVCHVFQEKGLDFDADNPDIEIQYAFGMESSSKLKLKPIRNESDQLVDITPDDKDTATLLINVRDLHNKLDVWRLNASRPISGPLESQDKINSELSVILADYPGGN